VRIGLTPCIVSPFVGAVLMVPVTVAAMWIIIVLFVFAA
jgi:hypothetical protein